MTDRLGEAPLTDDHKPWVAYLWECGDEYCDCSQGFIQRHHPACHHHKYEWGDSHRIDTSSQPIWEGRFETDGSLAPIIELENTLKAMKQHWPEAFERVIDINHFDALSDTAEPEDGPNASDH